MQVDRDAFFWQVRGVGRVVRRGKDVSALSGEHYQNDELVATATALIRRM